MLIATAALLAGLLAKASTAAAQGPAGRPARGLPADVRGLALVASPGRWDEELLAPGLADSLAQARAAGANALLVPLVIALDALPLPERAFAGDLAGDVSRPWAPWTMPSAPALEALAAAARAEGLALALQVELLASPSGGRAADRVMTRAAEWERFFDDQDAALMHVARSAELLEVELLIVASGLGAAAQCSAAPDAPPAEHELAALRRARWARTLANLRGVFAGELAYAEGWGMADQSRMDWTLFDRVAGAAFEPVGVRERRPERGAAERRWSEQLADLAALGARHEKQVLVSGIGASATDAAWARPAGRCGDPDEGAQALVLGALARAWPAACAEHPELAGLFLWSWSPNPGLVAPLDAGHCVQRAASLDAVRSLFARGP